MKKVATAKDMAPPEELRTSTTKLYTTATEEDIAVFNSSRAISPDGLVTSVFSIALACFIVEKPYAVNKGDDIEAYFKRPPPFYDVRTINGEKIRTNRAGFKSWNPTLRDIQTKSGIIRYEYLFHEIEELGKTLEPFGNRPTRTGRDTGRTRIIYTVARWSCDHFLKPILKANADFYSKNGFPPPQGSVLLQHSEKNLATIFRRSKKWEAA